MQIIDKLFNEKFYESHSWVEVNDHIKDVVKKLLDAERLSSREKAFIDAIRYVKFCYTDENNKNDSEWNRCVNMAIGYINEIRNKNETKN